MLGQFGPAAQRDTTGETHLSGIKDVSVSLEGLWNVRQGWSVLTYALLAELSKIGRTIRLYYILEGQLIERTSSGVIFDGQNLQGSKKPFVFWIKTI